MTDRTKSIRRQETRLHYLRAMLIGSGGELAALARSRYMALRAKGAK